jgi:hypothetical protein
VAASRRTGQSRDLRVFEDYFVPFEPARLFYNLSVWESAEDLRRYAYRSARAEMSRGKDQWMSIETWRATRCLEPSRAWRSIVNGKPTKVNGDFFVSTS